MRHRTMHIHAVLLGGALLSGCTTLYEGKYDYREGWREAEIVQIAAAAQISRPGFYTCIRNALPRQRADQEFAIVKYRRASRTVKSAIPLPADHKLQVGAKVYADVDGCEGRIAPRQVQSS